MLFSVKQVHTPDHCYFLLEADDLDPIRDFLDNGLTDCVAEINPVSRLAALDR